MKSQAFIAGWMDYHLGRSGTPRDPTYLRGSLLDDWVAGWRRAVAEQDSRHWEKRNGSYVYVQMPRHPLVADQPSVSRAWAR
jgi:hypothetical protein